jgi:dethiobiotin synthetase
MKIFVTGIDTNIGKTVFSAILCKSLGADYFKPIQSGDLDNSDSKNLNKFGIHTLPEALRLPLPKSPNFSSPIPIKIENINLPKTDRPLVVEGAGGVLVPLNQKDFIIDLAKKWEIPVILVCKSYLGSLNHTLLTIEAIRARNIKILGLVFNGDSNEESEDFLTKRTGLKILLRISKEKEINQNIIEKYAQELVL